LSPDPIGALPLPCGDIGFLALMAMASPSGPVSEIRCVIVHFYPDGIKRYGHEYEIQHFGKRAKPVKKMRFIPKARAFEIARRLQGTRGCTVSVV